MSRGQRRILLALVDCDRRILQGIERYALEQSWDLSLQIVRNRVLPWGWKGDGMLTWLCFEEELMKFALAANMPVVDFSPYPVSLKCPQVLEDHADGAKLVAEHFLARRFLNFVFYSQADRWVFEQRGQHFSRFLKQFGCGCTWLRWHKSADAKGFRHSWRRCRQWIGSQLKKAPKPLVILCADDQHALEVLDACEFTKINVPEEVAIVGVGNSLLAPDAMSVPISSVDTGLSAVGYRGAKLLDELMNGGSPPASPILMPAAALVTRMSSEIRVVKHPGVDDCLRFIKKRLGQSVSLSELENIAGSSRSDLCQAFLNHLGQTPMQMVTKIKIEHGKNLLAITNIPIIEIAGRCGYQGIRSFYSAFKRQTGLPPNQYREKFRSG
jgi:LacI family transcriptional regulator